MFCVSPIVSFVGPRFVVDPYRWHVRQKNVDHTVKCIELAYVMGIPTMRVNTGTRAISK